MSQAITHVPPKDFGSERQNTNYSAIQLLIVFPLVLVLGNAYAATDFQCLNDCTSRGYQRELCLQKCSYGTGGTGNGIDATIPMQQPPAAATVDSTIFNRVDSSIVNRITPFEPIDVQGAELKAQRMELERQENELRRQQIESQRLRQAAQAQQVQLPQQALPVSPTSGWERHGKNKNATIYTHPQSKSKIGSSAEMWVLIDHDAELTSGSGKKYLSEVSRYQYDCANNQLRSLFASFRSQNMGGGSEIASNPQVANWQSVAKNSLGSQLFNLACWNKTQTKSYGDGEKIQSASAEVEKKMKEICGNPEFSPLMESTSCFAKDITFSQLSDSSKISKRQKEVFVRFRSQVDEQNKIMIAAIREFGGDYGKLRAPLQESHILDGQKLNLELYRGELTWGNYNLRRKEQTQRNTDELRNLLEKYKAE